MTEYQVHGDGSLVARDHHHQSLTICPHAIERWKARFNSDLAALAYRALTAGRLRQREAKRDPWVSGQVEKAGRTRHLRKHGSALFVLEGDIVVTVLNAQHRERQRK